MRTVFLFVVAVAFSYTSLAQKTIEMHTLWQRPQVHVIFGKYTISFTIKDIDKALKMLAESGDHTFGASSGLDTTKDHTIDLLPDVTHTEYRSSLQVLIQDGVGSFLISSGHAFIQNAKHKPVTSILVDEQPPIEGSKRVFVEFYDSKHEQRLFSGTMKTALQNRDLGID